MTASIQGDFIQTLVQLAPPGVTAREKRQFANSGAIYYQDENFQTILGLSYCFQDTYAYFNLTETTEAERAVIGARHTASRPQDMTEFGWGYEVYAKGELQQVRDGVAHLLNSRVSSPGQDGLQILTPDEVVARALYKHRGLDQPCSPECIDHIEHDHSPEAQACRTDAETAVAALDAAGYVAHQGPRRTR